MRTLELPADYLSAYDFKSELLEMLPTFSYRITVIVNLFLFKAFLNLASTLTRTATQVFYSNNFIQPKYFPSFDISTILKQVFY